MSNLSHGSIELESGRSFYCVPFCQRFVRWLRSCPVYLVHSFASWSLALKGMTCLSIILLTLLMLAEFRIRGATIVGQGAYAGRSHNNNYIGRRNAPCTPISPCQIQLIADLDRRSRYGTVDKPHYVSKLLHGTFYLDKEKPVFLWRNNSLPIDVCGKLSEEGRGMELSELVLWGESLLAFDDRTGIVYEIMGVNSIENGASSMINAVGHHLNDTLPIAKYILTEEEGSSKGMKIEWACEKEGTMYVGSFGKEFTTKDGSKITGESNFWIVKISDTGIGGPEIERINWKPQYTKLRIATGTQFPGYLIHEAVNYSEIHKKWFFLPRRVSTEAYSEKNDEARGSNIILAVDPDFDKVEISHVEFPVEYRSRGFSSFKFIPGTNDSVIVALRTEEDDASGVQKSYISVFRLGGELIMDEILISGEFKYEGVELW